MVYLIWDIIGRGGRGEIKHGLKRLHRAPLRADVGYYLSWFFALIYRLQVKVGNIRVSL